MVIGLKKLPVDCDKAGCSLPVAYLKEGVLIIESRHHGEKHITVIRVDTLLTKLAVPV